MGILTDDGAAAQSAGASAEDLGQAQTLAQCGEELKREIEKARKTTAKCDVDAIRKIGDATTVALLKGVSYARLADLPATARAVQAQTADVEGKVGDLAAAYPARQAAVQLAATAAATICGNAQKSSPATENEVLGWKQSAQSEIAAAARGPFFAAQARIETAERAANVVAASRNKLTGFEAALKGLNAADFDASVATVSFSDKQLVSNHLAAANVAAEASRKTREPVEGLAAC